jgi:MFS family permease
MAEADRPGRWMYLNIPYQIAYGTLSSLVILYILDLHGSVIDASYAITFSNALWVLASIFWGRLIDTYNRRRVFIALSFIGLIGSLLAMYAFRSIIMIIVSYGVLSFMITANSMPMNLLIMETNSKERWAEGFSRLQMFMALGGMAGFMLVTFLSGFVGIGIIMLALVPFAVAALLMTGLIKEPARLLERRSLLGSVHAFNSHLITSRFIFLRKMTIDGTRAFIAKLSTSKLLRMPAKTNLNMLYAATLTFYVSATIFNTAYPAGLRFKGLDNFQVLLVLLMGYIIQTMAFYNSGRFAERRGNKLGVATTSLEVRGVGYAALGVIFLVLGGAANFVGGFILYPIAAGMAYALFYTAFNTILFEALGDEKRGRKLGVYSGMAGLGSLAGALMAGYLSFYIGYWFAFILAGILAVAAGYLIATTVRARAGTAP